MDLANLPGPNPKVEEGNEGDISETDEDGNKIKTFEKMSDNEDDSFDVARQIHSITCMSVSQILQARCLGQLSADLKLPLKPKNFQGSCQLPQKSWWKFIKM